MSADETVKYEGVINHNQPKCINKHSKDRSTYANRELKLLA
jgi:hypothetical protein